MRSFVELLAVILFLCGFSSRHLAHCAQHGQHCGRRWRTWGGFGDGGGTLKRCVPKNVELGAIGSTEALVGQGFSRDG